MSEDQKNNNHPKIEAHHDDGIVEVEVQVDVDELYRPIWRKLLVPICAILVACLLLGMIVLVYLVGWVVAVVATPIVLVAFAAGHVWSSNKETRERWWRRQ